MQTLQQHLDDLDRLVTNHATQPEIRSQLAFISREVAALETNYVNLLEAHASLQEEHSKLKNAHLENQRKPVNLSPPQVPTDVVLPGESCL
jgi:hypothetical protein